MTALVMGVAVLPGCQDNATLFGGCSTQNITACPTSDGFDNPYEGQLELLSWTETLRKASLELVGKLPTEDQVRATQEHGQRGFEASLAEMMREDAFLSRVKELYNDHFLTDKYIGDENAIELLDEENYPNLRWFDTFAGGDEDTAEQTNDSLAREPLELIAHVVRNEKPFSEILTADYTMANGFSAPSLIGLPDVPLVITDSPEQYRTIFVPGVPHAGILTSPMFLNRFPTSDTNRNRHRSRMAYKFFLDIDVNRFGSRPVDVSQDFGENPTLNNPDCTVCHTTVDPAAGLFMNWDERGVFSDEGWYDDMLPPGFNGQNLPGEQFGQALQWFARQLADNPRFALATTKTVFEGLTGQKVLALDAPEPMVEPGDDSSDGAGGAGGDDLGAGGMGGVGADGAGGMGGDPAEPPPPAVPPAEPPPAPADTDPALERAYDLQQAMLRVVQERFSADDNNDGDPDLNFKVLVREVVLTPYFRAKNATPLTPEMEVELSTFGTARWLTPEHLSRKIQATTGISWRRNPNSDEYLLDTYRIFYGGIDSDQVTQRVTDPNGVMVSLAQRMAYEVACYAVSYDFSKDRDDRLLFPGIDHTDALDPQSDQVREAVRYLHARILGEEGLAEEEIDATITVLLEAHDLGRQGIANETVSDELAGPCRANDDPNTGDSLSNGRRINRDEQYTVRAWMAALSYLLSDYRFLYE